MISIITCSIHEEKFRALEANYAQLLANEPHEIIRIPDAKSLCEGYNRGLDRSKGDILIFCHDDIEILTPDFAGRLKNHMANFDLIGLAGTDLIADPNWLHAAPPHLFGQVAHFNRKMNSFDITIYATPRRIMPNIQGLDGLFLAFRRPAIEKLRWDAENFTGFHFYDLD